MPDKDKLQLKRTAKPQEKPKEEPTPISAGPVNRVVELALNPSREKMREYTVIDRLQGRLFPQLDMVDAGRQYVLEIAMYRQDPEQYQQDYKKDEPVMPPLLNDFLFHTAQWQKSINGENMKEAVNIILAETEARSDDDLYKPKDAWQGEP